MKKIIIFAAALAAMTACNKSVFETAAPSEGFGYINLGISADAEMVVTKTDGGESTTPDYSNYMVGLFDETGNTPIWTGDNTNITNGYAKYSYVTATEQANLWKVPAGTYTVKVYDGNKTTVYDEANPLGKVRVEGSKTVPVTAGVSSDCTVTCTPVNAKVSFITTSDFNKVFTTPSVSLKVKGATDGKTYGTPGDKHNTAAQAFFEPVTITWTLSATLGSEIKTYSDDITLEKAKWTQVTFTTSSTNGNIRLEIGVNGEITDTINLDVTIDPITGGISQTEQTNQTDQPDQTNQTDQNSSVE